MAVTQVIYDVVVGAADSDQTTLTAGETALATNSTMYVKCETYSESVTFSEDNVEVEFEPGTVMTGTVTLSGTAVSLKIGAGSDFQERITVTGPDCSIICENGCDIEGITIEGTGDRFFYADSVWEIIMILQ